MVTVDEEAQAKEFLKRAEIRTMKKDLRALREVDALTERDKIAKIKTLEEQLEEQKKFDASVAAKSAAEKAGMKEVLTRNEGQERIAEKDLKDAATEQERQQIFLLEFQRLGFEKQVDAIDKEKDPALKLEKNKLLLQKRDQQAELNSILEQEKKIENEQKFITEKEQTTTIASQRKGLQESRQETEKKLEEVEKKRWETEKQIQDTDAKVESTDKSSEQLVIEKNSLRDKILGIDKSLREIYSAVMAREEEKRRGQAQEQIEKKETAEKIRATENEKTQRQQWTRSADSASSLQAASGQAHSPTASNNIAQIPVPVKKVPPKPFQEEEEARKKFIQDVEQGADDNQGNP